VLLFTINYFNLLGILFTVLDEDGFGPFAPVLEGSSAPLTDLEALGCSFNLLLPA
jgi:hypothetical protein